MRIPESLESLVDCGIIEQVVRPLMSGKEALVYVVVAGGEERVAKVYKDSHDRTFKHRSAYTEGRKVRSSRDQRAMESRSRHGRARDEAAWRNREVDVVYRLRDAGVRVPAPYNFIDGVLLMELVTDADGQPAPRLGELTFEPEQASELFKRLLAEVVRMLSAGIVHGDLSDYNVLMGADGPVIIDFPQAVDASGNQNAQTLLVRDVDNLHRFVSRFVPGYTALPYAQEMWALYQRSQLVPDAQLTGRFRRAERPADTRAVMSLIGDAAHDERRRRQHLGLSMRGTAALSEPEPPSRRAEAARLDGRAAGGREHARGQRQGSTHRDERAGAAPSARGGAVQDERLGAARPRARAESTPGESTKAPRKDARYQPKPAESPNTSRREVRYGAKPNGSRWGSHARNDATPRERPAAPPDDGQGAPRKGVE